MPDFSPTPTRQFQNVGMGNNQNIHDMKWATRTLVAGAIPTTTNFFGAAPSSDLTVDRYEQGNTLVSSGKLYTIYGIFLQVYAGAAAVFADFEKLLSYTCIRLVTAQKEYGVFPVSLVPAGGGIYAQGGNISVTPAAAPGGLSVSGLLNGQPGRNAAFTLANPLIIQANQSFYAELLGPTATAQTLTGALNVRIVLDGVEQRAAS
jgi:hypothetical protein